MDEKQDIFTLMGGRVKIKRGTYNPTSDAVWLAAFAPTRGVRTVLDIGIGTGGVALCYAHHNPNAKIMGIDISDKMLEQCAENALLNNLDIELLNKDITKWKTDKTFDLVLTNPPYFRGTPAKHNAHHNADLMAWTRAALKRVRPNGYFCIITDASTTADIISQMNTVCGDINIFPLFGAKNTAERVLISGRIGSHGISILHAGTSMNNDAVLRDGLTINDILATLGTK